eukprot:scaffold36271_cov49-Phaeocystis_antarctica.AAC.3
MARLDVHARPRLGLELPLHGLVLAAHRHHLYVHHVHAPPCSVHDAHAPPGSPPVFHNATRHATPPAYHAMHYAIDHHALSATTPPHLRVAGAILGELRRGLLDDLREASCKLVGGGQVAGRRFDLRAAAAASHDPNPNPDPNPNQVRSAGGCRRRRRRPRRARSSCWAAGPAAPSARASPVGSSGKVVVVK